MKRTHYSDKLFLNLKFDTRSPSRSYTLPTSTQWWLGRKRTLKMILKGQRVRKIPEATMSTTTPSKNLVVCIDGTSKQFGISVSFSFSYTTTNSKWPGPHRTQMLLSFSQDLIRMLDKRPIISVLDTPPQVYVDSHWTPCTICRLYIDYT